MLCIDILVKEISVRMCCIMQDGPAGLGLEEPGMVFVGRECVYHNWECSHYILARWRTRLIPSSFWMFPSAHS